MTTSTRPVARATWEAAAARADRCPERRLPCPGCAASVKGANLADHVRRAHLRRGDDAMAVGPVEHVGHDRRARRAFAAAALMWVVGLGAALAVAPGPVADAVAALEDEPTADVATEHVAAVARSPIGVALLAGVGLLLLAVLAARAGRPRARVVVGPHEVVLRHRFGTGQVRAPLPATVEAGSLVRHVRASGGGEDGGPVTPAHEERVGSYVRLVHGRRSITVGCPGGGSARKHWDVVGGGRRTRWDVTVSPTEMVALQYALAAHGALGP